MNSWLFLIYFFSVCELVLELSLVVWINYKFDHQSLNIIDLINL